MKIGIIGAGNIGGTLTRRLASLGHGVFVSNSRGPQTLRDLAAETGAKAVTSKEAAQAGEVVIIAIPERSYLDLPQDLFEGVPPEVTVIETGNYYPRERDGAIEPIEKGMTETRWVSHVLGRPVVKAFNVIYADHLMNRGKPAGTPGRIALPIAGDDPRAKAVAMKLVDELGFDPVDAGGLDDSWRQQPGTPVYGQDFDAAGVKRALSEASRERKPAFRATDSSPGSFAHPS